MIFIESGLPGAFIIEPELMEDQRGFFARSFCQKEFEARGLNPSVAQCNISYNIKKGTLRGMHYQAHPHQEAKLVRCTRGAIYDVIIDLRPQSSSYLKWISVGLSMVNRKMLYVPEGFAHGFQTLENDVEVFYQMSTFYVSGYSLGIRWNDPAFKIEWPLPDPILSDKDRAYEDYSHER